MVNCLSFFSLAALEKKRSCWTNDTFSIFPKSHQHLYTNYSQAIHVCESPQQANSIIPLPFLHYCLDSVSRWTLTYNSYWILQQDILHPARANDLQSHPEMERRQRICWRSKYNITTKLATTDITPKTRQGRVIFFFILILYEIEVATWEMILFRNGFAPTLELALFRRLDLTLD